MHAEYFRIFFTPIRHRKTSEFKKTDPDCGFQQQGVAALVLLQPPPVLDRPPIVSGAAAEAVWRHSPEADGSSLAKI
jgi:hypothetical protein